MNEGVFGDRPIIVDQDLESAFFEDGIHAGFVGGGLSRDALWYENPVQSMGIPNRLQSPSGPRKGGMSLSTVIPAPVKAVVRRPLFIRSPALRQGCSSSRLTLDPIL